MHLTGFGVGSPPVAVGAGATGPSEERVVERALPRSQPTRIPARPSRRSASAMIVAPSRRRCFEVKPCRSQCSPRRARSRPRSTSWTSASRCLAPSYSWIRRVPSIRRSARAMNLPCSSKISCWGSPESQLPGAAPAHLPRPLLGNRSLATGLLWNRSFATSKWTPATGCE